jgi:hypothetical protein
MSRRHHGRPHHGPAGSVDGPRRGASLSPGQIGGSDPATVAPSPPTAPRAHLNGSGQSAGPDGTSPAPRPFVGPPRRDADPRGSGAPTDPRRETPGQPQNGAPQNGAPQNGAPQIGSPGPGPERNGQCTAPQLRRFIKSRPYVPMHELRRRFAIEGDDDDVTPVRLDPGWVFVGLPNREGSLLGDLLRAGEIGYELSLDPRTPIVIGVYPMRPIPRS